MRLAVSLFAAIVLLAMLPGLAAAADATEPCAGSSTPAIDACFGQKLQAAEANMERYFQAAINRYLESREDAAVLGLRNSQQAFEAYRAIECGAVHERWKGGSIRGVMELTCSIRLTDQRTHALWRSWLTYPDSTPPTLPEPVPTQ